MTESNNKTFFLRSNGSGNSDGYDEYQVADVSFAPIQMGDIYFYQRDKPKLKYAPTGDITPYETSLLFPLFAIANMQGIAGYYDFRRYIYMNGLDRHFEEVE